MSIKEGLVARLLWKRPGLTGHIMTILRRIKNTENNKIPVILYCHPRGGSTWLMEILKHVPTYSVLWEPFNPASNSFANHARFDKFNINELTKEQLVYAQMVLHRKILSPEFIGPQRTFEDAVRQITSQRLVLKCVKSNLIRDHLYSLRPHKSVFLLRHPCAVIASQLTHPDLEECRDDELLRNTCRQIINRSDTPENWQEIWDSIHTREEMLAFVWGARSLIPLQGNKNSDRCLIFYERLVTVPEDELKRLFLYLKDPIPEAAYAQLNVPSATSRSDSHIVQFKNPLTAWKYRLDARQVLEILNTTRRMGDCFYTNAIRPDI